MTGLVMVTKAGGCGGGGATKSPTASTKEEQSQQQQLSLLAFLVAALRKSMVSCRVLDHQTVDQQQQEQLISSSAVHHMEIGWPTDVQHITHVTFDRFHGFLGLPVEFEVEIPRKVPSASASVFGVSADSMQCSYDSKGNSVPIILLLMQERLYSQAGLKAEGIFRINPENSQEQEVRDQLNRGVVPDDIDVHCLAGLIKTWFRELPSGVLDGLSPEQVLQCNNEEDYIILVKQLQPTEAALLNWAIDLMADVVEEEEFNKMNARNIAMVFAPNMTQMSDPLTALMHAVQVMNLLKTLITKTLREREEAAVDGYSPMSSRCLGRESDEEYDSQREMDTSSVSRGPGSDCDEHEDYDDHNSEYEHEEDEGGCLSEIEQCFLRQLNQNDNITRTENDGEAEVTLSDGKTWSWRSSSSISCSVENRQNDGSDGQKFDSRSVSKRNENVRDVEMDEVGETASSLPPNVSS